MLIEYSIRGQRLTLPTLRLYPVKLWIRIITFGFNSSRFNLETSVFLHSSSCPNKCCLCPLPSVLWSSRPVWIHAEIFKHRFHSPLHSGVHPQDYCLRSTGEQLQHCALQHTIISHVLCFPTMCYLDTFGKFNIFKKKKKKSSLITSSGRMLESCEWKMKPGGSQNN